MATSLPEEQCVPVDRDQDANVLDQLRDWARDNFVLFWPIPVVGTLASLGLFKAGLLAATLAFLLTLAYWLILLLFMSRRLGARRRDDIAARWRSFDVETSCSTRKSSAAARCFCGI